MKNIFIAASLLVISCNYKSESDKQFERVVLMADCTNISTNKGLIKLKEIQLDAETRMLNATNRLIKATGRVNPEQKKDLETIPLEIENLKTDIDSLNADIDRLKIKIYNQIKQQ
jgi:hypothetical protein